MNGEIDSREDRERNWMEKGSEMKGFINESVK